MEQSSSPTCTEQLAKVEYSSQETSQNSTSGTTQEETKASKDESTNRYDDSSETQSESMEPSLEDKEEEPLVGALSAFTKTGAKPKWLKCKLCNYECWPPNARHHLLKCPVLKKSPHLRDKMLPNPTPPPPPPSSRGVYAREEDNPYYFTRINTAPGYICNNCGLGLRGAHRPRHLRSCWKRGRKERLVQNNTGSKYYPKKGTTTESSTCSSRGDYGDDSFFPLMESSTGIWGFQNKIPVTSVVHHSRERGNMKNIFTEVAVVSVGEQWILGRADHQLSVQHLCS